MIGLALLDEGNIAQLLYYFASHGVVPNWR